MAIPLSPGLSLGLSLGTLLPSRFFLEKRAPPSGKRVPAFLARGPGHGQGYGHEQSHDAGRWALNAFALGRSHVLAGRFGMARRLLSGVVESLREIPDPGSWSRYSSFAHSYYAMALAASGHYAAALTQLERGLSAAISAKQPLLLGNFYLTKAGAHLLAADWPMVMESAQLALELPANTTKKTVQYLATDSLAWAESFLGRPEQALIRRVRACALRELLGGDVCRDWYEAGEAELLLNSGRPEAALEQAKTAVAAAAKAERPFSQAIGERVWACALARLHGPAEEWKGHFLAALSLCREQDQVVNEALTEVLWGQALREQGDKPAASRHFERGIELFDTAGCEYAAKEARRHAC